jgi:hypothetical protein
MACRVNRVVGISRLTPTSELLDDFALQPFDALDTADLYDYADSAIMPTWSGVVSV